MELTPSQEKFVASTAPSSLFIGGLGCGKTHALIEAALTRARYHSGATIGLVRKDIVATRILELSFLSRLNKDIVYSQPYKTARFSNGSSIRLLPYTNKERLALTTFTWIGIDCAEEFKSDEILDIRHHFHPRTMRLTSNPVDGQWLREFAQEVVIGSTYDNPWLPDGYAQNLERLVGREYLA